MDMPFDLETLLPEVSRTHNDDILTQVSRMFIEDALCIVLCMSTAECPSAAQWESWLGTALR
jgi:hypothetical protein